MAQKISNDLLSKIAAFSNSDPAASMADCATSLGLKAPTLYNWYRNLKSGKWPSDYAKTDDGTPLEPDIVKSFVQSFSFSHYSSKILKKLVCQKCLKNKYCFAKQHKILKRLFGRYPNVDFWLHVDLGDPREDILLWLGKGEPRIRQKFLDFTAKDSYTPFVYDYQPSGRTRRRPKKRGTPWDFYDS